MNLYQYCGNNAVNCVDPWGESRIEIIKKGPYIFKKFPGDTMHGGAHWHVFKHGKELGRVSTTGKVVTGAVPKTALKILKGAGLVLSVFTFIDMMATGVDAATISDWAIEQYKDGNISFEELMEILEETGELENYKECPK